MTSEFLFVHRHHNPNEAQKCVVLQSFAPPRLVSSIAINRKNTGVPLFASCLVDYTTTSEPISGTMIPQHAWQLPTMSAVVEQFVEMSDPRNVGPPFQSHQHQFPIPQPNPQWVGNGTSISMASTSSSSSTWTMSAKEELITYDLRTLHPATVPKEEPTTYTLDDGHQAEEAIVEVPRPLFVDKPSYVTQEHRSCRLAD